MLIVIDPGHGGAHRANRGPTGYVEADGVLDISLRLEPMLQRNYAASNVKMTRRTDATVALYDRPKMANEWGANLFVSVHTNAASDPSAGGIEVYYSRNGEWGGIFHDQAKKVAQAVQNELVRMTGLCDRGIKTWLVNNPGSPIHGMDYLAVIRQSKCPAILVEAGFHTNPREEALLKTAEFKQTIAMAINAGIVRVYGKSMEPRLIFQGRELKNIVMINQVMYLYIGGHYIPVREIGRGLELEVEWNGETKTAYVD